MTVQFITSPKGEELAVLPRAEWEALMELAEDALDNAEASQIEADYRAGKIEGFPGELVFALSHGENPVRTFRNHRGLTAEDLAEKAGISRAYLSQIEGGKREGTGKTLKKLANALGVDVDLLLR